MSHVDIHTLAEQAVTEITMNDLMQAAVDEGASDLHIRVGRPPVLRCSGALEPLDCPEFTAADTAKMLLEIANEEQLEEVEKNGGADFVLPSRKLHVSVCQSLRNVIITVWFCVKFPQRF